MTELHIEQVDCQDLPLALLLSADPCPDQIARYLAVGTGWRVRRSDQTLAAAILMPHTEQTWELMNIAVQPQQQGRGLGAQLLQALIAFLRARQAQQLLVGTGAFGYPLTFYQRAGFRVMRIEHDYFLRHYAQPLFEDGIQHKDRLILSLALS